MNEFQQSLSEIEKIGWLSNPAAETMLMDYAKYHTVFAIAGCIALLLLSALSLYLLIKFKKAPNTEGSKWGFAKKAYLSFSVLSILMLGLMVLLVADNASNATRTPSQGFFLFIENLRESQSIAMDKSHLILNEWIQSESSTLTPALETKVQAHTKDREHTPEAIKSGLWLIAFILGGGALWRTLIKRSASGGLTWSFQELVFFFAGLATPPLIVLLFAKTVANIQGAVAPLSSFLSGLL